MLKLAVENVSKSYGKEDVIKDISIKLEKGEIVSVIGPSGVGKTTLFNVISGLLAPDSGRVVLDGEDISGVCGRVSYMLQKDLLLQHKTVLESAALPLLIKGEKKSEALKKADSYFGVFNIEGTQGKYPDQLSGGMRQRVALLRTYLFSKEVALLDEPFSALDAITKGNMHSWYMEVMKEIKLTTLFITHDIDEALMLSDRIYIMTGNPGRIEKELTIDIEKPRSEDFLWSDEFALYKKYIMKLLKAD